mmetsp:Transcript_4545/g.7798  ORF Transcript_4545/g.7798 Transcript_4545/m.7798 type:complete len:282 (-) Transcript_4545:336-1181(-)
MKKHAPGAKKTKKIYAHVNPLSDAPYDFPLQPSAMDWNKHFPQYYPPLTEYNQLSLEEKNKIPKVSFVDVGCGFGNLLLCLSQLWPNKLGVGMEIRQKAVDVVQSRLDKLRTEYKQKQDALKTEEHKDSASNHAEQHKEGKQGGHHYQNVSVIHTNVMKFITHYFEKQSLDAMLFCFPDPHFKKSNHRRRIITVSLLDYYAYLLRDNGLIYNITDVKDLYEWTTDQFDKHPLFERLTEQELKQGDVHKVCELITNQTDEAQRVTRNEGQKYLCVYRKKCIL